MHLYAIIRDGKLVERRKYKSPLRKEQIRHIDGIPQARPIQVIKPDFDPKTEVREGPAIEITDSLVTETWTVRKKTDDEIAAQETLRFERVNAQRAELCLPPVSRKTYEKFRA
jgi:hypothetical protein